MAAGPSLRERKKDDTRQRLMAVALRLFEQRGYEETTVEDLAAAANVAPRTFFRYFPTKVEVLFGDHEARVGFLRDRIAGRSGETSIVRAVRLASIEALERLVAEPGLYLTRSRLVASVPMAYARSRQLDAEYERVIADALAADRKTDPATDLEARVLAKAAWSATQAAREVWLAQHGRRDPRALVEEAFDRLERGLR